MGEGGADKADLMVHGSEPCNVLLQLRNLQEWALQHPLTAGHLCQAPVLHSPESHRGQHGAMGARGAQPGVG